MTNQHSFSLIEDEKGLQEFIGANKNVEWIAFDTEFIGERRYFTLLCLIQIATENGNYLIDSIKIKDISPILDMIENPDILKITHAGENDYKVLNLLYNIIPRNVFDTQKGAGFIGYGYPISYGKILFEELKVRISKGYAVADWESRPIPSKLLDYALKDVIYLRELYFKIQGKIDAGGKGEWYKSEMLTWEEADYYEISAYKEAMGTDLFFNLNKTEKLFHLRLLGWRLDEAHRLDESKQQIISNKIVTQIVKNIGKGKDSLLQSRIIPSKIIHKNWKKFNELQQKQISDLERDFIINVPDKKLDTAEEDFNIQILDFIIKKRCIDFEIASSMVLSKADIKNFRKGVITERSKNLESGWKSKMLGEEIIQWIKYIGTIKMEMIDGKCVLSIDG